MFYKMYADQKLSNIAAYYRFYVFVYVSYDYIHKSYTVLNVISLRLEINLINHIYLDG